MFSEIGSDFRDDRSGADDLRGEEKLQYTLKGVEKRSLDLMRSAAQADGMKIGAWVSKRMREAAEASLASSVVSSATNIGLKSPDFRKSLVRSGSADSSSLERMVSVLEARLRIIQGDLDNLRETQYIILSKISTD